MTELRPCPLCGCEAEYRQVPYVGAPFGNVGLDATGITVACTGCGCTIPSGMSQESVTEIWNRRAGEWKELNWKV